MDFTRRTALVGLIISGAILVSSSWPSVVATYFPINLIGCIVGGLGFGASLGCILWRRNS